MQFIVENAKLADALTLVKGCIPPRSTIPILSHVAVEAKADSFMKDFDHDEDGTIELRAPVGDALDERLAYPDGVGDSIHDYLEHVDRRALPSVLLEAKIGARGISGGGITRDELVKVLSSSKFDTNHDGHISFGLLWMPNEHKIFQDSTRWVPS